MRKDSQRQCSNSVKDSGHIRSRAHAWWSKIVVKQTCLQIGSLRYLREGEREGERERGGERGKGREGK
eukprot:2062724-Rhodomonas_salina.1